MSKKQQLFELYVKNLESFRSFPEVTLTTDFDLTNAMVCPICWRVLYHDDLIRKDLTLEHVPPKSTNGRASTLTCRGCNNLAGTLLDSHVSKQLELESQFSGKNSKPIKVLLNFREHGQITAFLTAHNGNFRIVTAPKKSNPKAIERLEAHLSDPPDNVAFDVVMRAWNTSRADIGKMRIAYLIAFSRLGYSLFLNPNVNLIREQIMKPKEKLLDHLGIFATEDSYLGVTMVEGPREAQSILVSFRLSTGMHERSYLVVLPAPHLSYSQSIQWWSKNVGKSVSLNIERVIDSYPLDNPLYAHRYWDAV